MAGKTELGDKVFIVPGEKPQYSVHRNGVEIGRFSQRVAAVQGVRADHNNTDPDAATNEFIKRLSALSEKNQNN